MQTTTYLPAARSRTGRLTLGPSLFDALLPDAKTWHKVVAVVVAVALIVACAKFRFYLPQNPTPVTLQTFGVLMAGSVLGWRWGGAAVLAYIALGALGAPVFASQDPLDFRMPAVAWSDTVMGVTGGYIIGFLVASGVAGACSQLGFTHRDSLWGILLGGLLLYVPAIVWLAAFDFGWPLDGRLLMDGMYIYLPGDVLKILAAASVTWGLWVWADRRTGRGTGSR